jgi:polar amino acid transport system substrate-binding protein
MTKSRLWAVLMALVLVIGSLALASCGDDDDEGDGGGGGGDTTAQDGGAPADLGLIEDGKLLVGTDTPYPPFEIGQPPDITGYDIEILNEVAKRLNLEVTYQDTSFDTIFRDLGQGRFDIVAAASTILPDREQTVDFSDPYYLTPQSLLVTPGSDVRTVDDLAGTTVGAQDGTTGEFYANDETEASEVRGFPEGPDAINALRGGQVDAVIIDFAVAQDAVQKQGGIEIAQKIVTNELYGFPVAEDNDALREEVNRALAEMKEDGTFNRIYQKYFKKDPPASVIEGTHEPS